MMVSLRVRSRDRRVREKGGEAKAEPLRPPGFQSAAEAVPRSPGSPASEEECGGGVQGSGLCHRQEVSQGMVDGPGGRGDQGRVGKLRGIRRQRQMCPEISEGADSPLHGAPGPRGLPASTPQILASDARQVSRASLRVLTR